MPRLTISLKEHEKSALLALAEKECRDLRQQAALIIRQELQRRGLLQLTQVAPAPVTSLPAESKPEGGTYVTD